MESIATLALRPGQRSLTARPLGARATGEDRRTRERVVELLWREAPLTAGDLAGRLDVSPAAVRRHLDALEAQGRIEGRTAASTGGRGRPARNFRLTEAGRDTFPHAYDDLAVAALRHLARQGGDQAVAEFAAEQLSGLEERADQAMRDAGDDQLERAVALAEALSREGYAATASAIAGGGQLCQHHCPVAHVAAEFPQLCEAETAAISRLVGSHVQRLATIARGDPVCTTNIPPVPAGNIPPVPKATPVPPEAPTPSGRKSA